MITKCKCVYTPGKPFCPLSHMILLGSVGIFYDIGKHGECQENVIYMSSKTGHSEEGHKNVQ